MIFTGGEDKEIQGKGETPVQVKALYALVTAFM